MNVELDAEKRLQALVAKDRIRIKEFFIDFDKLRKGCVGEAGVSIYDKLSRKYKLETYLIRLYTLMKYVKVFYFSYGIFEFFIFLESILIYIFIS